MISAAGSTDFAQLTGSDAAPVAAGPNGTSGGWSQAIEVSQQDAMHGLNPLQHVPVVGMIYRQATGEQMPMTMRVAGAGIAGGPLGMIGAALMGLFETLLSMKPDTTRPAAPSGMSNTGSESGVEPVTPGTMSGTQYVTLATQTPDFLQGPMSNTAIVQNGNAAYQSAMLEWHRAEAAERGLA